MKRRPQATVLVLKLPHIDAEAVRIEVDCRYSTTGLTSISGPLMPMTRPQMITAAVYAHEERCGDCDTSAAHEQGDPSVRQAAEVAWSDLLVPAGRRYAEGRRN